MFHSSFLISSFPYPHLPRRCKEYLAQLQKSLKAKEAEVAETRRIAEECRANGHDTSVASSLTDLTPRSGGALERSDGESITSRSDSSNSNGSNKVNKHKRKSVDFHVTKDGGGKRAKQVTSSSTADSSSTSGDENDAPPDGRNITFGKEQSSISMSDMTDSNKDSLEGASTGAQERKDPPAESTPAAEGGNDSGAGAEDNNNSDSISSISSTAAVVRGLGGSQNSPKTRSSSRRQRAQGGQQDDSQTREKLPPIDEGCNANGTPAAAGQSSEEDKDRSRSTGADGGVDAEVSAVPPPQSKKKKRPRSSTFHLDYREVFLKSNVPQLVASLNGRVVTWNDFLLSATGLGPREVGNLTVFGMVESDQLSDLYAMVSKALAYRPSADKPGDAGGGAPASSGGAPPPDGGDGAGEGGETTWRSITLRCAPFRSPARAVPAADGEKRKRTAPGPLYMNITLMGDEDPGKRCFHCVLTDKPGEDGRVGGVTPGLFDLIGRANEKR